MIRNASARDIAQRVASRDDINRVIIGIGGQGSRLVNEVRHALRRHGAEPEGVEFMAMDSDRIALANLDAVAAENQVYLQAPDEKITETMVPWLPREFRPKAGGGCGMQRLTGKAMYMIHRQRIFEAVNAVMRRMRQRTQMTNFMFVIVGAFGGGTGSGMLIDFSIDLRRNLSDLMGHEPMIFGIGVLPSRSETIQRANGVALLKELHFLLSRKEPVVVGGRDYSNPFELFFVVGREVMGAEKDDELLQSIVRFTIDLGLIPSSGNDGAASGKGAGFVDLQDIRTIIKGASHMFATFGYYRAEFPEARLREYFDVVDRIAAIQARLPTFASQSEEQWKRLNDRKVQLAEAQRVLAVGQARAKRLRAAGILGINRPELQRLQEEIGRAEDALRQRARELKELEAALPRLQDEREELVREAQRLERRQEELLLELASPAQSQNTLVFPVAQHEVEHLTANRKLVLEGSLLEVMEELDRLNEYHDKTMEVIGKNKILFMPMLNYRMAFHTAALFQPAVLRMLSNFGFVRFDGSGNPVITDDQLWMVMAMLSSARENVDPQKLSARAFKEIVENYIAKRAEVKTLPSEMKRFEVAIHSWMIGLQVAPIAPGYPPRLKELEWLSPEYDKLARERELAQHHAWLYGDPSAFTELTGIHLDRMDATGTHERITSFWSSYAPIDSAARWMQVPPVLAEALVALDALKSNLVALTRDVEAFTPPTEPNGVATLVDQMTSSFRRANESVLVFQRYATQEEHALKERLRVLVQQLERTREGPRDATRFAKLQEMSESALAEVAQVRRRAEDLRIALDDTFASAVKQTRERLSGAEVSDRFSAAITARLRRALAELDEQAARMDEAAAHLPVEMQDLEDALVRFLSHLRSRTSEGGETRGARGFVSIPVVSGDRPEAPSKEDDLLGKIIRETEGIP